jgi:predicted kinase
MAQIIFSTLRTTRSVLEEARNIRVEGESIRFWEEKSGGWWSSESYPLWRVYASTFAASKATQRLSKSKTYRQISKEELENAVGLPTARGLWAKMSIAGNVVEPTLVIMAGPPLSGKTTLANEIVRRAQEPIILIENDAVREHIVSEMKLAAPKFNITEHRRVFNVSWELIRLALSQHCNVIFDATNRTDSGRAGAYAAAAEYNARIMVIFMKVSPEMLSTRYGSAGLQKQKAYDKLGSETYNPKKCSVPYKLVDSNRPADVLLKEIAEGIRISLTPV